MTAEIIVNENNCTGCLICQLWCSFFHKQKFSPSEAYIQITNQYGLNPKISYLDGCTKCGQCAQHCLYDALRITMTEGK